MFRTSLCCLLLALFLGNCAANVFCPNPKYSVSVPITEAVKTVLTNGQQMLYVAQSSRVDQPTLVVSSGQAFPDATKAAGIQFEDGQVSFNPNQGFCLEMLFPEGYDTLQTLFADGESQLVVGNFTAGEVMFKCNGQAQVVTRMPVTVDELYLWGDGNCKIDIAGPSVSGKVNVTVNGLAEIMFDGETSDAIVDQADGSAKAFFGEIDNTLLVNTNGQSQVEAIGGPQLVVSGTASGNSKVQVSEGTCKVKTEAAARCSVSVVTSESN